MCLLIYPNLSKASIFLHFVLERVHLTLVRFLVEVGTAYKTVVGWVPTLGGQRGRFWSLVKDDVCNILNTDAVKKGLSKSTIANNKVKGVI